MQGILWFLFLTCYMLTVSLSDAIIEENNHNTAAITLIEKYPEQQRRKLPLFPKNNMKFVVTPKPHLVVYSHKQKIMTKKPVMPHLSVKPRSDTTATTQLVSRKPLMKLRTFTIQSRANQKFSIIDKIARNVKHAKKAKTPNTISINKTESVMQFSEDPITEVYLPEESRINMKKIILLETDERAHQNKKYKKSEDSVLSENNAVNFLSEEEQDRKEFIFLENKDVKQLASDMLDNTGQGFNKALETTTDYEVISDKVRVKRSKYVIEEENMASTTVSGLKYTGRETRHDDVYFKNINS